MRNTCRLCWQDTTEKDAYPLYELTSEFDEIVLAEKIAHLVDLEFDDELPKAICVKCKNGVENFYNFKCSIEQSERMLRQIRRNHPNKPIVFVSSSTESENICEMHIIDDDLAEFMNDRCTDDRINESSTFLTYSTTIKKEASVSPESPQEYFEEPYYYEQYADDDSQSASTCSVNKSPVAVKQAVLGMECHSGSEHETHIEPAKTDASKEKDYFLTKPEESVGTSSAKAKNAQCCICYKRFKSDYHLRRHLPLHSNVYECKLCSRKFRGTRDLKEHIQRHSGEKNYTCNVCGNQFYTKNDLASHLRKVHRNVFLNAPNSCHVKLEH